MNDDVEEVPARNLLLLEGMSNMRFNGLLIRSGPRLITAPDGHEFVEMWTSDDFTPQGFHRVVFDADATVCLGTEAL